MRFNREQLDAYVNMVSEFNDKLNCEAPVRLLPIMSDYAKTMAYSDIDPDRADAAVTVFSTAVHAILSDCLKEYLTIQTETLNLKLIAPEELADILSRLEKQFDGSFRYTRKLLKDYITASHNLDTAAYIGLIECYRQDTDAVLTELATYLKSLHLTTSGIEFNS